MISDDADDDAASEDVSLGEVVDAVRDGESGPERHDGLSGEKCTPRPSTQTFVFKSVDLLEREHRS